MGRRIISYVIIFSLMWMDVALASSLWQRGTIQGAGDGDTPLSIIIVILN
jgi:uncharacterized protein (DUF983 family)